MTINRRKALSLLASGAATPLAANAKPARHHGVTVAFKHGVASGDPHTDSVLLWTRVTPMGTSVVDNIPPAIHVGWEIAPDAAFRQVAARGVFETHVERDFTVKVVADGLR